MGKDTKLHKACHQGELPVVQEEVETNAADVNAPGAQERTPLHRAVGINHTEIAKYPVEKGADINKTDKSGRHTLHWAVMAGHAEMAMWILELGADVNVVTKSGMSALMCAADSNRLDCAKILIAKECDQTLKNADEKTALDLASANKDAKDLTKLLKTGKLADGDSKACVVM